MARGLLPALAVLGLLQLATAVDRSKFRYCKDAGFCKRHREKTAEPKFTISPDTVKIDEQTAILSATASSAVPGSPPFNLNIHFLESGIARVRMTEADGKQPRWESPDIVVPSGTKPAKNARILGAGSKEVLTLVGPSAVATTSAAATFVGYSNAEDTEMVLALWHNPFKVDLYIAGYGTEAGSEPAISVNERGLSYFEHRRQKGGATAPGAVADGAALTDATAAAAGRKILDWGEDGKPIFEGEEEGVEHIPAPAEDVGAEKASGAVQGRELLSAGGSSADSGEGEPGMWEENFGSHQDSKPYGPTSVGCDITFPHATHVYGIPEHASSLALKATDGSEGGAEYEQPYRLYNLDVFEYELDNPMALYGSIPFMLAHGPTGGTVGVFWNNPTESYVDIKKGVRGKGGVGGFLSSLTGGKDTPAKGVATRWISESGIFDLSLVPGPSPKAAVRQYTSLTGTQALPPLFALGYHQCRWNYKDEADVYMVDAKFEELAFPYDVLWLDIEHTNGKRYFTWDSHLFPNPVAMQEKLAARGHKMVTIIDPHIKRDPGYWIHSEAQSKGLYVRNSKGQEYDGWCWPGSSSYLDFTSPQTRSWWAEQFRLDKYSGSSLSLYTWNDMNEPSVFNGPEVSMNKDALSIAGVEHREWHNLYGFYQLMATYQGQLERTPDHNSRPFALSRAFYAGTQRYGAIWTGDNDAKWEHLAASAPMLLTIGLTGLTFSGADVGGFFNNPSSELLIRWYQAGAFQPFFRAHAHIDTARREPWLFGEDVLQTLRSIVRTRYSYLPFWYTQFAAAHRTGLPTMRPLWMEYPAEAATFAMEDQWLVGSDLLVKPVVQPGVSSLEVYFPGAQPWYNTETLQRMQVGSEAVPGGKQTVQALLGSIPVFQRGGSIIPRQMRPRRSSSLMAQDPYTLIIALDNAKQASGQLYLDDGSSFDYEKKQAYRLKELQYKPLSEGLHELKSSQSAGGKAWAPSNTVERLIVLGLRGTAPKAVTAVDADGARRELAFSYEVNRDVLTVKKPDVKVAYDWAVQLQF